VVPDPREILPKLQQNHCPSWHLKTQTDYAQGYNCLRPLVGKNRSSVCPTIGLTWG
jgi:hypothetical protein